MEGTGKNLRLTQNPPFNFEGRRVFDATTGAGSAAVGFADIVPNTSGGPGTLYRIFAPNLRPQLTKQWNVFVERKLTDSLSAQAGYVGSRSSHMVVPFDFNQPEPDPGPVSTWRPLDQRRPLYALNPDIGVTSGTNSIGVGAYDALQTSVRQRPTEGLEFLASYTYSKSLSDNVGYYGVGWGQTSGQGYYYLDSTDPLRDYGPSPYDMRHNFSFAAIYELPFGRETKFGSELGTSDEQHPRRVDAQQHLPDAQRPSVHRLRRRRSVAAGDPLVGAAQPSMQGERLQRRRRRCVDRHQLLPERSGGTVRRFRRWHPATVRATGTGTWG